MKYDYASPDSLGHKTTIREAVRETVLNYFRDQLGWSLEKCEERVEKELNREIPKGVFDTAEQYRGWDLSGASIIDVGSGQGGGVLEALHRGADAHGAEPGGEFAKLSRMRLKEKGFDPKRIYHGVGENLPFKDNTFDYAVSLQVLEHVEDPFPLMEEIYRVLKPGGRAIIRCENYLSFREQHYRIPWIPLLPKSIGCKYLYIIGLDPKFLSKYVYYTTYPQIWNISSIVGFENDTYKPILEKAERLKDINSEAYKAVGTVLRILPAQARRFLARWWMHSTNLFTVGVRLHLSKPKSPSK